MSTFDGILPEFPDIQIDYFRKSPVRPAPLACFLSHVHTDHLKGLESFRAPFIYCSPATRELLLRLEKFPHRMNFEKGILETRRLHYKHLATLLRPIPLHTPTEIELTPRRRIRVTLFDANHCPGAVVFLIEGSGKAIIYTGDIRAERWWVDGLKQHPILIPYTLGQKRLDRLYLDTTFAAASDPFREFPTKARGLVELLQKLEAYPDNTLLYFRAWTFGYEEVWTALSAALNAKVHVDRYQMGLYRSLARLSGSGGVREAPALCGFKLGNTTISGCLSEDESSRIHSCVSAVSCSAIREPNTVYVVPIVNRTRDGVEIPEVGAGGGLVDLSQTHELEIPDESALAKLQDLCDSYIKDDQVLSQMRKTLSEAFKSQTRKMALDQFGVNEEDEISLEQLVAKLSQSVPAEKPTNSQADHPNIIRFPFSRHSSYSELCELVAAFQPKDVWPCTVDPSSWNEDVSIRRLFGHLCSGSDFAHDNYMRHVLEEIDESDHPPKKRARHDNDVSTQSTRSSSVGEEFDVSAKEVRVEEDVGISYSTQQSRDPAGSPMISQPQSGWTSFFQPYMSALGQEGTVADGISSAEHTQASHAETHRVHGYLQEHRDRDQGRMQLGPLPSLPLSDDQQDGGDQNNCQEHSHWTQTSPQAHSSVISLPESALAPSVGGSDDVSFEARGVEHGSPCKRPRSHQVARTRARVAAYLAAREGSYSAWADVAPVSTGNNHAEVEEEL
ncbi:DNA repair metallo-beta-lactamase [Penicillium argentinense]|uniref:Protein artemis n=1 Tax=Penicillium argentinense TaxID=1131581 RepID=A0A9W9JYW0_9EURO|nr:DNA repair metallo-beta-lactamase [Penicillium argentinense]KAJ5085997.1 DNA repair metallo-beta-lactamase [Penicillium argentinense]